MGFFSVLKIAARAAVWLATPNHRPVGLPVLLFWAIVLAAFRAASQLLAAGPDMGFNPYGLNAVVAWVALDLAVAALFVPAAARTVALSAMLALSILAEVIVGGVQSLGSLLPAVGGSAIWRHPAAPMVIFAIVSLWWIGAMIAVLRGVAAWPRLEALGRVIALWVALLAASAIVPHAPVFVGRDFDISKANWWEILHAQHTSPEQNGGVGQAQATPLEQSQQALLQAALGNIAPAPKGATAFYAIGVDGWAEDVFFKELDGGLAVLSALLPIRGRTVRLINNHETLNTAPLANRRNFAAAVHAVGQTMNKDDDVLLLFMTSHGEPTGFGLRLPDGTMSELTPQEVAATLNNEGIKNRIVIVSACYAGTFVPPLQNDNTIVLTAADATHTSFGCAPERDWTYFGDALFRQSLRPGRDLQQAFDNARVLIQGWELMDRAPPSNPQGFFGAALSAKLVPFFAAPPPPATASQ
jgi:hypothetical protein